MVKRLIESVLPLKEISEQASREKSIRHGHISTLHIWWARRPLVACRAVVFGALVPDPADPECPASFIKLVFELLTTPAQDELKTDSEGLKARKRLVQFIKDFCTWEASNNQSLIGKARKLILEANHGVPPKVLDPFAGGGAIPLEALRLGCESHAVELNPVAHLIELCTLVYPQKYGKPFTIERKAVPKYLFEQLERQKEFNFNTDTITIPNRLAYDVERWGKWVLEEARKEIGQFYPSDPDESIPVAYLWARTAKCPNPTCGAEIPLVHQLWLANKGDKKVAFRILPDKKTKQVRFEVVEGPDIDFDPKHGTMRRDSVTCPFCNQPAKGPYLREEGELGRFGEKLMAVVLFSSVAGKTYRVATQADEVIFGKAYKELQKAIKQPINGLPPIPNEPIPYLRSIFNVYVYGFRSWGQLFNSRQALAIVTFIRKVREAHEKICQETGSTDYAKALSAYLALALDRLADGMATLCVWEVSGEGIMHVFGRQALPIIWDYAEANPFGGGTRDWDSALDWILRVIKRETWNGSLSSICYQGSATRIAADDQQFSAVITDPPYYDAVPYSDLSDFFYVWLKRTVGELYPDIFSTPLTPKGPEIVQLAERNPNYSHKTKEFFEAEMTKAFWEMKRVLKPDGICVVVFAHKTTTAWETLIAGLLKAGLSVTASWPLHTEMKTRLRARDSAALASSVFLICRKRSTEAGVSSWKEVQDDLEKRVKERLEFFLSQGIRGADAFLSAIGPAMEVFGRYEGVEKITGDPVTIGDFLDKVREVVSHHALATVLEGQSMGDVDPVTAFYVLWRWTYDARSDEITKHVQIDMEDDELDDGEDLGEDVVAEPRTSYGKGSKIKVPFDEALKLARAVGAEIDLLMARGGVLQKEKEYVRLLGPEDRKRMERLGEPKADGTPPPLIDLLHRAVNLWSDGGSEMLKQFMEQAGLGEREAFWQVAQALSNLLPLVSKEKQLIDGLLGRRTSFEEPRQKRFFSQA